MSRQTRKVNSPRGTLEVAAPSRARHDADVEPETVRLEMLVPPLALSEQPDPEPLQHDDVQPTEPGSFNSHATPLRTE